MSYSKEEKEAISRLYMKATLYSAEAPAYPNSIVAKKDLVILLNLLEKQEKIINKMSEYFEGYEMNDVITFENKEQVKEYFEEEVEKEC